MKTENQKLGSEPAFPTELDIQRREFMNKKNGVTNKEMDDNLNGMSKRFYAACAAMQGILASGRIDNEIIPYSFHFADELLKQENEWKQ